MTYGDGVSDVDVTALLAFHEAQGTEATVTAIQPAARYGALEISGTRVTRFEEKPKGDSRWINGGFFVCNPAVLDRIEGDHSHWELKPLEGLARDGQLSVFKHDGFWAAMDTMRDKTQLEAVWAEGRAPWKVWR